MVLVNARFLTQHITGVQRYATEISVRLKKRIPDLAFAAPDNIVHGHIARLLEVEQTGRFTGHFWEQMSLPGYCRQKGNPLLVSFSGLGPLKYPNRITTIHDLAFYRHPQWFSKKYAFLYRTLMGPIARSSRHIITVSEFSKSEIISILDIDPALITVAGNAAAGHFTPGKVDHNFLETRGIRGKYILAVGSLDPRKNFHRLVKAWEEIDANMDLVIVGGGHRSFSRAGIDVQASSGSGKLVMPGYLNDDELVELYRGAHCFAYPSLYEGFGIPPLEAMACGVPVLVSDRASLPEVCGDAAVYCDAEDIDNMAERLAHLVFDEKARKKLSQLGLERSRRFSWDRSAHSIAELIERKQL